jgi:hypothetical protein
MERISRSRILGVALAGGMILAACGGPEGGGESRSQESVQQRPARNEEGDAIKFSDDKTQNNIATGCDGRDKIYVDMEGYGDVSVVQESELCVSETTAPEVVVMTFGDGTAENNVIATCDGDTRVYRFESPRDTRSDSRNITLVPDSTNCLPPEPR